MIDGKWPIERHAEWAATSPLYCVQQLDITQARCPHCGSDELKGSVLTSGDGNRSFRDLAQSVQSVVEILQRAHRRQPDPMPDTTSVECAVCEHVWDLEVCQYRRQDREGVSWQIKWTFERLGSEFNPLRVLARYYQRKANQQGEEHAA